MELTAILAKSAWFSRQSRGIRTALIAEGRVVRLARDQWLYTEGESESGICAVLAGKVRIEAMIGASHNVLLDLAGVGAVLGQARGFGGGRRIVTARAAGPAAVMLVSDVGLARIADNLPDIWRAVSELVYGQLDRSVHLAALALALGPRARVAARLLALLGDGSVAEVTQADLGEMCGLSRKVVNVHLADFRRMGLIATGYGGIRVHGRAALRAIAGI